VERRIEELLRWAEEGEKEKEKEGRGG